MLSGIGSSTTQAKVQPLLRASATAEIDTLVPLDEVADALESIADSVRPRIER
jgi:hypothetical protein